MKHLPLALGQTPGIGLSAVEGVAEPLNPPRGDGLAFPSAATRKEVSRQQQSPVFKERGESPEIVWPKFVMTDQMTGGKVKCKQSQFPDGC